MKGFVRRPLVTAMMLSGLLLIGGCMVGPDYVRPDAQVNDAWVTGDERIRTDPIERASTEAQRMGVDLLTPKIGETLSLETLDSYTPARWWEQ